MLFWCWRVRSVKGVKATGKSAFGWEADWISRACLRDTTTLLVPTSSPTGLAPGFTKSSIRSGGASVATFHRWSLFSAMLLPSAKVIGGASPRRRRSGRTPALAGCALAPGSVRCRARLLVLGLLRQPAVEKALSPPSEVLQGL